jgi:hypothetical protein
MEAGHRTALDQLAVAGGCFQGILVEHQSIRPLPAAFQLRAFREDVLDFVRGNQRFAIAWSGQRPVRKEQRKRETGQP